MRNGTLTRLAWLPIPLMAAAMVALWVANAEVAWHSPALSWLLHYGSAALSIALIVVPAARIFLASGQPSVLMLGCGVMMSQIGVITMPIAFARSTDSAFAIYSVSILASALGHFAGVATSRHTVRLRSPAVWLAACHAGGAATMGLVIGGAFAGWMPTFFIDGQGGTVLRTLVVSAAVALFGLTAGLLWQTYRRTASPFFHWYALGLVLIAIGLAGSMVIAVQDSPLQWVTRSTQVIGAVYMCVAVLISTRENRAKAIPLAAVDQAWVRSDLLARFRQQTPLGWLSRYGLAVGAVAASLGFRAVLTGWVGHELPPYITFYPAIMVVALLAGFGPGLLATAVADVAVAYWVLGPAGQFTIASPAERLGLVIFSGMGVFMSAFAELYRRRRDKAAAYDREEALREGRERLAAFAEATFEGIVESEAGRMVDCNEQFARMTGYAVAELTGMEIADVIAPEDRDRAAANFRQNRDSLIEHAVVRKDGTRIVVEARGRPSSPGGATRHTVIRDITERKRAEEALRQSEERSRNVIKYAPASIYEMSLDGERFISVNDTMCQVLGYTREELMRLRPRDLLDDESRGVFQDRIRKKLAGADLGESVVYRARTKDGRWIDAIVNVGAFVCKDGKPDGVFVVAHDITARKRLERLYAVLSRVNETIVRTDDENALCRDVCRIVAEDGGFPLVWIGSVTGREVSPVASSGSEVAYLSEIRIEMDGPLGIGPTAVSIRENRSVINDDFDTNAATAPWRQSALGHGFRASAAFPLHRAGKTIGALTLYAARPGAFDDEQVKLLEALSADVSYALEAMDRERRRAEAETALRQSEGSLRESDRRKTEFLAVLSHELRNPLAPIRNSLHILELAAPGGDQARRAQTVIDRQVSHLARLVDDLLDVTRISRNKIRLERQVLELNDLVRRTVEDYRSLFVKGEVRIEADLAPERVSVDADGTRLAQVVGNLLQNAAKFTGRGGETRVSVAVDRAERQAIVRVSDTGVGMPPEVLARLFQPFMQADTTLDRSKGGLGLGLALVKGMVELHGGHVSAHSDGLGKGAAFVVRLPLAPEGVAVENTSRPSAPRASRRVLIIEDNIDAAESLSELLEFGEHQVQIAYNGPDGIAKARQFSPDIVLCDIGLPGMDGFAVARAFRADEALKGSCLVALSGYALPEDLQRAQEAGFDRHLAKPPSLEKIDQVLAGAPATSAGAVLGAKQFEP